VIDLLFQFVAQPSDGPTKKRLVAHQMCQVLQSLDASAWGDSDIDGLLSAADASGDGQLQVEDWLHIPVRSAQERRSTE